MPPKKKKKKAPRVHKELEGFDLKINPLGEVNSTIDRDKINEFLNRNVEDKKLKEREETLQEEQDEQEAMERPIRVLVAKVGLDGHDRGAKVIATALRDAGMEVIYTGLRQTPEMVVQTALQEDVDAIGISILSGAHMTVFPKVLQQLKENDMEHVLLTGGGIIPESDAKKLRELGSGDLFPPGTPTKEIVGYIRKWVSEHQEY